MVIHSPELDSSAPSAARVRTATSRLVAAAIGLAAALVVLMLVRPETLVHDWHGWRQADTQTIARHFAADGIHLLHPRIAWGGDGPGYVEAELQLYTAATAVLLRATGGAEWTGRALSAAFVLAAAAGVFAWAARRFGPASALAAVAAMVTAQGAVFLVSVQPDALGLCLAVLSVVAFWRWLSGGHGGWLAVSAVLLAAAGGVKPTFLGAGVTQAVLVVMMDRKRLKQLHLWLAWAAVLLTVGGVLVWGAHLHRTYGNTFGVVSGGDSKFPTLGRLASPMQYVRLAEVGLAYGPGPLGLAALVWLSWRRRLDAMVVAAWVGYAAAGLVAMRYASEAWLGSHYHALGLFAGAVSVAAAVADVAAASKWRRVGLVALALVMVAQLGLAVRHRRGAAVGWADREVAIGRALRALAPPDALVIVRANVESIDAVSGGPNNFEDPRVFYLSNTRGWVLPNDRWDASELDALWRRGARWYADPAPALAEHPDVLAWLEGHGTVSRVPEGVVVSLKPPP
jgi:hypothetical protein